MLVKEKLERIMAAYEPPLKWAEVAAQLDMTQSYLNHIVAGRRPPTAKIMAAIERWSLGRITSVDWVEQ